MNWRTMSDGQESEDIIALFQRDTKHLHSIAEKFQELDGEIGIELVKSGK